MVAIQNQETGTRDITYNLISLAYHALQGAETYGVYARDAHGVNDTELAEFFVKSQEQSRLMADEAKQLLQARINTGKSAAVR
jgi:rubrerythrin